MCCVDQHARSIKILFMSADSGESVRQEQQATSALANVGQVLG